MAVFHRVREENGTGPGLSNQGYSVGTYLVGLTSGSFGTEANHYEEAMEEERRGHSMRLLVLSERSS